MTQVSRFHDVTSNSDVDFSETFATVHLDGVEAGEDNGLKVTANDPAAMNVLVDTGKAWVQGRWYKNTASVTLTIEAADATNARYDRIILRSTVAGSPGSVVLAVLKGTAAGSPTLPALTQTPATVYEIPLATIYVTAGKTSIVAGDITDARENLASGAITYTIDNGGDEIPDGSAGFLQVPFNCKILGWTIIGDQTGSIVVDVKSSTYAAFPTNASIAGSEKPTLTAAQKNQDYTLTTWTVDVTEGAIWEFVVDSCTTTTRATISILVARVN